MVFCAIIFILVPIFLSSLTGKITSTDWIYRHNDWAERYLRGDFTPLLEYPPIFHWIMIILTIGLTIPPVYFQVIFALLSTLGILYYVLKIENEETLLYVSILLASSIAFVSFAGSLMPQAMDYLIFPLICLAYFKKKYATTTVGLLILFFMHITGMLFIMILLAHSLLTKRYKFATIFTVMIFLLLPFFYYYNSLAPLSWSVKWDWKTQLEWEKQYMNPIYMLFLNSGFLTWILLPYASYKLYKRRFKLTDAQLLYVIWIGAFFSFVIFQEGIWRMISYQIVPLSILVASLLSKTSENNEIL
jgi:hypothetical protein